MRLIDFMLAAEPGLAGGVARSALRRDQRHVEAALEVRARTIAGVDGDPMDLDTEPYDLALVSTVDWVDIEDEVRG